MADQVVPENIMDSIAEHMTLKNTLSVGFAAYNFTKAYDKSRQEGDSGLMATTKGVSSAFMTNLVPLPVIAATSIIKNAPRLAVSGYETMSQQARTMSMDINRPFATSTFVDNQQIYTMRQAGMAMAERSKYNLQQAIMGNEAQYFHK